MNSTANQPVLPDVFGPRIPQQHKLARQTSREVYRRQRNEDRRREAAGRETRGGLVLRLLARYWNTHQCSPTAYELLRFGQEHEEPLFDVNSVRPAITHLVKAGLVEPRAKRNCRITGELAHTWAIREQGSEEPR